MSVAARRSKSGSTKSIQLWLSEPRPKEAKFIGEMKLASVVRIKLGAATLRKERPRSANIEGLGSE